MRPHTPERLSLMIVAGEPSGDAHAASLVRALREHKPETEFEFFGATGRETRAAGVESIVRADELAIVGLLEIARALPRFRRAYQTLKRAALERRPDAVVLVDWPDFNLALARALHRRGLKVIYYVSPQLWAWRAHRARQIRRDVDLLLSILPFEPAWYERRGIRHVEFVGHPMTGEVRPRYGREEFCRRHGLDPARPLVALLPGSRRKELQRILPVMLDAARLVARERPEVQFVIPLASTRADSEVEAVFDAARHASDERRTTATTEIATDMTNEATTATAATTPRHADLTDDPSTPSGFDLALPPNISFRIVRREAREALAASDAAAVASGTATLEAALVNTPLAVVYKESFLNWHALGSLIRVEHYGLVNLIAGRRLAAELIQNDFTPAALACELSRLLDPARNAAVRVELREAVARLGAGGASQRAAETIIKAVREWKSN